VGALHRVAAHRELDQIFHVPERTLEPPLPWLASLWSQTAWLERNFEYHLLANHLFKNAKALLFAGSYFEDPAAGEWLHKGAQVLAEQLVEQFLPDGGHFERSPCITRSWSRTFST